MTDSDQVHLESGLNETVPFHGRCSLTVAERRPYTSNHLDLPLRVSNRSVWLTIVHFNQRLFNLDFDPSVKLSIHSYGLQAKERGHAPGNLCRLTQTHQIVGNITWFCL